MEGGLTAEAPLAALITGAIEAEDVAAMAETVGILTDPHRADEDPPIPTGVIEDGDGETMETITVPHLEVLDVDLLVAVAVEMREIAAVLSLVAATLAHRHGQAVARHCLDLVGASRPLQVVEVTPVPCHDLVLVVSLVHRRGLARPRLTEGGAEVEAGRIVAHHRHRTKSGGVVIVATAVWVEVVGRENGGAKVLPRPRAGLKEGTTKRPKMNVVLAPTHPVMMATMAAPTMIKGGGALKRRKKKSNAKLQMH